MRDGDEEKATRQMATAIWNRAVLDGGGRTPGPGDAALAAMMALHGLAMNGGVLDAVGAMSTAKFEEACAGYAFFGFHEVPPLLIRARGALTFRKQVGSFEASFDNEYRAAIPDDGAILSAFKRHLGTNPELYAPIEKPQ